MLTKRQPLRLAFLLLDVPPAATLFPVRSNSMLRNYVKIYNHNIPQRALKHQTPIQALKDWQEKQPDLFAKRVYNQAGLDV